MKDGEVHPQELMGDDGGSFYFVPGKAEIYSDAALTTAVAKTKYPINTADEAMLVFEAYNLGKAQGEKWGAIQAKHEIRKNMCEIFGFKEIIQIVEKRIEEAFQSVQPGQPEEEAKTQT